jgi:drug/metabolite transporter (DMT)-like permease
VGSVILAALIFSESPSPVQLLGVVFVLGGLLTATSRWPPRLVARPRPT